MCGNENGERRGWGGLVRALPAGGNGDGGRISVAHICTLRAYLYVGVHDLVGEQGARAGWGGWKGKRREVVDAWKNESARETKERCE